MEPKGLNSLPPDDDPLDHLLASHLAEPPLPDAGFSTRVAGQLPAPRASLGWLRGLLCALGAAAGVALFFTCGPSWDEIVDSVSSSGNLLQNAISSLSGSIVLPGLIVCAVSLLIAFLPPSFAWRHHGTQPMTER